MTCCLVYPWLDANTNLGRGWREGKGEGRGGDGRWAGKRRGEKGGREGKGEGEMNRKWKEVRKNPCNKVSRTDILALRLGWKKERGVRE